MSRNPTPAPDREPAFEVPDAAPAPVTAAPVTAAPVTAAPVTAAPVTAAPVTAAPVDAAPVTAAPVTAAPVTAAPVTAAPVDAAASPALAGATVVDGPSLVPDRSSMPGDPARGEGVSGSLSPEVAPVADLADPFGLDLDVGGAGSSQFGAGALELPDGPAVVDLPRTEELDVGVDWNNLGGGTGTLDGRGVDTFEGGSDATGPADPTGMVSEGGFMGWLFGSGKSATPETEPATPKATDGDATERGGTDVNGLTTPGVKVTDDGVSSTVKEPTGEAAGWLKGAADFFMGKKNMDGSVTERQKQMPTQFEDGLPPDHPDYVGAPSERPPGSATDDSIEQSIRQGLGGDRGGDIDPNDDPNATPTDGETIYDPYDSVVNPGPDGFLPSGQVDESHLPDAMDMVDPYLADG